jgi:general stress protein 26
MQVTSFTEIEPEFLERVQRMVWCNVATIDRQGRPRSRILHPIWEGVTGWITTNPQTLKAKHLARHSYVSLAYIADIAKPVYVDCKTEWIDDLEEKQRIWELVKNTPPPVGFDPAPIYERVDHPKFGVLKLIPWRIELYSFPAASQVWKPAPGD